MGDKPIRDELSKRRLLNKIKEQLDVDLSSAMGNLREKNLKTIRRIDINTAISFSPSYMFISEKGAIVVEPILYESRIGFVADACDAFEDFKGHLVALPISMKDVEDRWHKAIELVGEFMEGEIRNTYIKPEELAPIHKGDFMDYLELISSRAFEITNACKSIIT